MTTFKMTRDMYHSFNRTGYVNGKKYHYQRCEDGLVERYPIYYHNDNGDKRLEWDEHARRTGKSVKGKVHVV